MFTVRGADGGAFAYEQIWQRRNLLLASVPPADETAATYVSQLLARAGDVSVYETQLVITGDTVAGLPSPGVAVADRWGEIYFVQGAENAAGLPPADELLEWLRFVQVQCPECQGETR
jgi:hypothetical protein